MFSFVVLSHKSRHLRSLVAGDWQATAADLRCLSIQAYKLRDQDLRFECLDITESVAREMFAFHIRVSFLSVAVAVTSRDVLLRVIQSVLSGMVKFRSVRTRSPSLESFVKIFWRRSTADIKDDRSVTWSKR